METPRKKCRIIGPTGQRNIAETLGQALEQVIRDGMHQIVADEPSLEVSEHTDLPKLAGN